MRYIDDFVIISPNRQKVADFISLVQSGSSDFGIRINSSKTRTNFDINSGEFTEDLFTWCGMKIHFRSLDVHPDYSNFMHCDIADFLTRDRTKHPGHSLRRQMQ